MSVNEKLQAVEGYLLKEFREAKIEIKSNVVEQTHRFQILDQGKTHYAIVVEAFLKGCETEKIAATLEAFMLAEPNPRRGEHRTGEGCRLMLRGVRRVPHHLKG